MRTDAAADVARRYERFARDEAPGRSALYEEWGRGVAADAEVAEVLARIAANRRQPPLVFAVTRMLGAPEAGFPEWSAWVRAHADAVVDECSRRSLQTNEPLRCAALLPALAGVTGPIALLEVGASAGLCLHPDRYSYRYRRGSAVRALDPVDGPSAVVLECELRGSGQPPLAMPEIVWRAGIDLAPLDACDPADRGFLTALAWPGETGRAERITAALEVAASDPPVLIAGDATDPDLLRAAAAAAPAGARLVVTTPGVMPHIPHAGRERLVGTLRTLDATWVSIDPPHLHAEREPLDLDGWDGFVLSVDGSAIALVDPLGASVEWRRGRTAPAG